MSDVFAKLKQEFDLVRLQEAYRQVIEITPIPENLLNKVPFQKVVMLNPDKVLYQLSLTKRPSDDSSDPFVRMKSKESESDLAKIREYVKIHQQKVLTFSSYAEKDGFEKNNEYTEFNSIYNNIYFKDVHAQLSSLMKIGRMRLIKLYAFMCNEWQNDCENKIIIPIHSNNAIKMVVNNEIVSIPEGEVWFANTLNNNWSMFNGSTDDNVYLIISLIGE